MITQIVLNSVPCGSWQQPHWLDRARYISVSIVSRLWLQHRTDLASFKALSAWLFPTSMIPPRIAILAIYALGRSFCSISERRVRFGLIQSVCADWLPIILSYRISSGRLGHRHQFFVESLCIADSKTAFESFNANAFAHSLKPRFQEGVQLRHTRPQLRFGATEASSDRASILGDEGSHRPTFPLFFALLNPQYYTTLTQTQ